MEEYMDDEEDYLPGVTEEDFLGRDANDEAARR